MILFILLMALTNSKYCKTNKDCDDKIWCNGKEFCQNNTCYNDTNRCHSLIKIAKEFNQLYNMSNIQIMCYETIKLCIPKFYCFSDEDCDDKIYCNGKEYCNIETNQCIKSSLLFNNLCQSNEICDFKEDKCIDTMEIYSISLNENNHRDILISIIVLISLVIVFTLILFLILKSSNEQKIVSIKINK